MEGTKTTKKRRSLAFLAMLGMTAALFCMGQPVSAQVPAPFRTQVAPNGVGDLLIYQLWLTRDPQDPAETTRDTLVALINGFGGDAQRFVHVRFSEGINSVDVLDFTVCLSPGDVWTAAIIPDSPTSSLLMVGNPGSCDDAVAAAGFTPPPLVGELQGPVPVPATFGYVTAYTMESPLGGDDTLFGVATPVNTTAGFSSSFNAVALVGFDGTNEGETVVRRSAIAQALAREGGVDKEILLGRWSADPDIGAQTQVVVTFPAGFQPRAADPVSLFVFDEEERLNFSPRTVVLPWEVNLCTFSAVGDRPQFQCVGQDDPFPIVGAGPAFRSGWFRIINNVAGGLDSDSIDAPPATRFPATGLVFSSFENGDDDYDQSYDLQWASIRGAGGIGGTPCAGAPAPAPPDCRSYNLNELPGTFGAQFAPWWLPGGAVFVEPGNLVTGALNRTGTARP